VRVTITRLTLLRDAPTSATRRAAFPLDEPLDESSASAARRVAPRLGHTDAAWCGPAASARGTAAALGTTPTIARELDDWDVGAWRGHSIPELQAADPSAVAEWMRNPAAAPHGGESLLDLLARVESWLDARSRDERRVVAVTHSGAIRAALVHALHAPPEAFWRIDVAPLSRTILHSRDGLWTVRAVNLGPHD